MPIRIATTADLDDWTQLRAQLWDDTSLGQHRIEAEVMLARSPNDCIVFLDVTADNHVRAFAEAALRHDHVNGCDTSPVAFLEGIFVRPKDRGTGIGQLLLEAVQSWAQAHGCTEFASDAHIDNMQSRKFHKAFGFDETDHVVFFRKRL